MPIMVPRDVNWRPLIIIRKSSFQYEHVIKLAPFRQIKTARVAARAKHSRHIRRRNGASLLLVAVIVSSYLRIFFFTRHAQPRRP